MAMSNSSASQGSEATLLLLINVVIKDLRLHYTIYRPRLQLLQQSLVPTMSFPFVLLSSNTCHREIQAAQQRLHGTAEWQLDQLQRLSCGEAALTLCRTVQSKAYKDY